MDSNLLNRLADKFFHLELPCTAKELKSAYRREAKKCHPDIFPGDEKKKTRFQRLSQAYEILSKRPEIFIEGEKTEEGILLSELGKGIKNGKPCNTCESKGYKSVQGDPFIPCTGCGGTGHIVRCPPGCKGSSCNLCKGVGWLGVRIARGYDLPGIKICSKCFGSGGFRSKGPVLKHFVCTDCRGKGQRTSRLHRLLNSFQSR